MGNILSVVENKGKRKLLGSDFSTDFKKRARVVGPDEDEQTPSIFSCRQSTGVIPTGLLEVLKSVQNEEKESCLELHKTKHKIFLSHSGAEKSFVEQLCLDLERKGYSFPFFDQRSHSLPKGKNFAPLILEAAKQCHVAVIVLSEKYLTSKWPMIELSEFYEAKKGENPRLNVLPLFFKLSREDLDDRSIDERWMPKWKEYASLDRRIDLHKWRKAVKALPEVNGFNFEQPNAVQKGISGVLYRSEVEYRSAITQAILELSPPDLLYGTSETVVGYDRLCKMLWSQFEEDTTTGVLLLGLYGMPGLGKTTMSKALCDYFHSELAGRVCRVDLGGSSVNPLVRKKEELKRQKEVLKQLWGFKNDVLDTISDIDQGRTLMRDCLRQDSTKLHSAVFLVIANVSGDQHSLDEARAYLEAGFCPRSRIMVTSTGQKIVTDLLSDSKFCKPVPDLTEEEAGTIFLRIAAPGKILSVLSVEEIRNLRLCVEQCRFSRDGTIYEHKPYHPLALRALANFFRNQQINKKSLSVWEKYLEDVKRGSTPGLFDILELQFKSLDQSLQLIFFDISLYGEEWLSSILECTYPGFDDWVTWLAELHMDAPPASVEEVLRQLERSGMINLSEMTMHQLYKEFAVWLVTKGSLSKNEWCVRETAPPYERTRLRIVHLKGGIPRSRVQREWGALVLLQLHSCSHVRELNLDGLDRLRHLELIELKNLEQLLLSRENDSLRFVWLSGLDSLKQLPDFRSSCIFLQAIVVTRCFNLTAPLRVEGCSELKTVCTDLHLPPLLDGFSTPLRSLRRLELSNFGNGRGDGDVLNLEGLELCSQLKHLTLANLPVKRILGLARVTSLGSVKLSLCPALEEAPEVCSKTNIFLEDAKKGSSQSLWPTILRDSTLVQTTDILRKLKELEDEAIRGGYSPSKSSLHLKLEDSLGPSFNYDFVAYFMALAYSDREKSERILPGLRSYIEGSQRAEDLFINTMNGIILCLFTGSCHRDPAPVNPPGPFNSSPSTTAPSDPAS
ncbi:hypothetical protein KC19_6G048600 [Ceratodon purpureus]|uniref:TIR domain-containing protein n=1 Tax=Ceratodon purpureus TaxID=3225 RepID=A0A8T0HHV9_CERPU|nr:hypothetical protein KC19_6G048600 [Ceratodon purpureus]